MIFLMLMYKFLLSFQKMKLILENKSTLSDIYRLKKHEFTLDEIFQMIESKFTFCKIYLFWMHN